MEQYQRFSESGVRLRESPQRRWMRKRPGWNTAKCARHRARKRGALPQWLSVEDRAVIQLMYDSARELSRESGVKFHVDHIVPLNGKQVCGLHVPWNLRVVTASVNFRKSNTLQ